MSAPCATASLTHDSTRDGLSLSDHGPDQGGWIARVTNFQLRDLRDEFIHESVDDALMHEQTLHRCAYLAGFTKT